MSKVRDLACCTVLVLTIGALLASPLVAWFVVAGVDRLVHSYPP